MEFFKKIKQITHLMKNIDFNELGAISEKIDLPKIMKSVGELNDQQLNGLMKMLTEKAKKGQHQLPPIDGDFYDYDLKLTQEQRAIQMKLRNFMETEVEPIANRYWNKAEFPMEIIPKLAALNICGVAYEGYDCPGLPFIMEGIIAEEIARVDVSISTFFGVHSGLAMGSIYLCGSEEQKQEWLPKMQRM
ncbi:MAG: acyl-CoA dehydrogenase, partial [Flavobacteriaceae bacterium]|nr:acyl-CoA dehydrogenase [Flavobacteriaceae bacterium]